jgi:hypothetical protein
MWSISVAPMPSMISMPVASFHSFRVAAGNASPADTHLRSDCKSWFRVSAAIARYEVGRRDEDGGAMLRNGRQQRLGRGSFRRAASPLRSTAETATGLRART